MNRGEIWQADPGARAGKRPVVILTRSGAIPYLNKLTVAEITSQIKGYQIEVDIDQKANLPYRLSFNLTISKRFPNRVSKNLSARSTIRR